MEMRDAHSSSTSDANDDPDHLACLKHARLSLTWADLTVQRAIWETSRRILSKEGSELAYERCRKSCQQSTRHKLTRKTKGFETAAFWTAS